MKEVIVTDPTNRGTLEHNGELVVFMGLCSIDQEIIVEDKYKLYVDGKLAVMNIAEKMFNKK